MGKKDILFKLIIKDSTGKEMELYETEDIFDIDCYTYRFRDREDLLNKMTTRFGKRIEKVFIREEKDENKYDTYDIMFENNYIPKDSYLIDKYFSFLSEDKERIKNSILYRVPEYHGRNIDNIALMDVYEDLPKYMNSYKKRRDTYFHLLNSGYIKLKDVKEEEKDYLKSIIEAIDTSMGTGDDIMIDKIRSGEIEPNLYDIEDYLSMPRYPKR